MRDLMSVAELAQLLNVTRRYVRKMPMRKHILRPVRVVRGRKYVLSSKAEAYRKKRSKITRRALRELARVSKEAGVYK
jgi:excisionase family DNA binding protein